MKRLIWNLITSIGMTLQPFFELSTNQENVLNTVRILSVISLIAFLSLQIYWFFIDKKRKKIKRENKRLIKDYRRFKEEIFYSIPSFQHYIRKYFTEDEILRLIKFKELKFSDLNSNSTYEMGGINNQYEFNRTK